jgi:NAD(P)-dependent dehydrogenase (short-subunit alcohol dehydrogenase family)
VRELRGRRTRRGGDQTADENVNISRYFGFGMGRTRRKNRSFRPMERMGTMDDVANAAEYLAGPLSAFVSGQHLLVSGGAPA